MLPAVVVDCPAVETQDYCCCDFLKIWLFSIVIIRDVTILEGGAHAEIGNGQCVLSSHRWGASFLPCFLLLPALDGDKTAY